MIPVMSLRPNNKIDIEFIKPRLSPEDWFAAEIPKSQQIINMLQQKNLAEFDKKHGTNCVSKLDNFNEEYRHYFDKKILIYATQMYFFYTEPSLKKKYGHLLRLNERNAIIDRVVRVVGDEATRNNFANFFKKYYFVTPTDFLEIRATQAIETVTDKVQEAISGSFMQVNDKDINTIKSLDVDIDKIGMPEIIPLETGKNFSQEAYTAYTAFSKYELLGTSVNSKASNKTQKIFSGLLPSQLNTAFKVTDDAYKDNFVEAFNLLEQLEVQLRERGQFFTKFDLLQFLGDLIRNPRSTLLVQLYYLDKICQRNTILYRRAFDVAEYAAKKKLYFGGQAKIGQDLFDKLKENSSARVGKVFEKSQKFLTAGNFQARYDALENNTIADEKTDAPSSSKKPGKRSGKRSKPPKKPNKSSGGVSNFRAFKVYTGAKLRTLAIKSLEESAPDLNDNDDQTPSKTPVIKKKQDKPTISEPEIYAFKTYILGALNDMEEKCTLFLKNTYLDTNSSAEINNFSAEITSLRAGIEKTNEKNIAELSDAFDGLNDRVYKKCAQIVNTHRQQVRSVQQQQQQIESENLRARQLQSFFDRVISQARKERLSEGRNQGGRVKVEPIDDLWGECIDYFHNRSFIYDQEIQFLDCSRVLLPNECLAYYVTQTSRNTEGALFCISIHRWKKRKDIDLVPAPQNDNDDNDDPDEESLKKDYEIEDADVIPYVSIPLYAPQPDDNLNDKNIDKNTGYLFRPEAVMDEAIWEDQDKKMGTSFAVIHVMPQT
ncbi:hypothetical protein [uncultured Sneathiella sp.]|uniref:hypothetical protein n=1 Tax=uncultured Sneathiella sp. TaxID=879315 RepID=UPI0030EC3205